MPLLGDDLITKHKKCQVFVFESLRLSLKLLDLREFRNSEVQKRPHIAVRPEILFNLESVSVSAMLILVLLRRA